MQTAMRDRPRIGVLAGWPVGTWAPDSFLEPLYRSIHAAALGQGCDLLLACGLWPADLDQPGDEKIAWPVSSPGAVFVPIGPWNTDGLLVVMPLASNARSCYVRELTAGGFPVVFVGAGETGPAVVIDNEGGVRRAIEHLLAHGHRGIVFLAPGGDEQDVVDDSVIRLRAYRALSREYGLDAIVVHCGGNTINHGRQATRGALGRGAGFTAVLAAKDDLAVGAVQALRAAGLQVPGDAAVVGFDDRVSSVAYAPPLTTVRYPFAEVARRAVDLLLATIDGERTESEVVEVPVHLVVRRSCGCEPGAALVHPAAAGAGGRWGDASRVIEAMAEAVLAEARGLGAEEVRTLCRRIVEAFVAGVETGDQAGFRAAFSQALRRAEVDGDVHAWQMGLLPLGSGAVPNVQSVGAAARGRAESMLYWAHVASGEGLRRQRDRDALDLDWTAYRVDWLGARLLTARDEAEVFDILAGSLPELDLGALDPERISVVLYERKGDDPAAWSVVHTMPEGRVVTVRFPNRQFSPGGLYASREPLGLALFPLTIQADLRGFVTFDAGDDFGLCCAIVRQVAIALRSARLFREAEEGRRKAEEASRMKSRLLSTVSHELRTPLSLIVGLSELLIEEQLQEEPASSERILRDAEHIRTSAHHLDGLIRDVLDLSRSEAGELQLVCERLDPAEVLETAAAMGEEMAREKGLDWRCEIPGDLPRVWGDRTRLRQVVINLVSNAVKFTAKGEVTLKVEVWDAADGKSRIADRPSQIADRGSPVTDGRQPIADSDATYDRRYAIGDKQSAISDVRVIVVSVTDTGLGIPPSEHDAIFDEFRQGERTAARGYGGMGLGLAICRRLVEMHGGEIWVESSGGEGEGSTFTFTLPVARAVPDEAEAFADRERMVLLLVEREESGKQLEMHLAEQGFEVEVLVAGEGRGWLTQMIARPPGGVVLDLGMASGRGWEVLRVLKGHPVTRDVPVLFYTLGESGGAVLEMDYLAKPVGTADLARALEGQGLVDAQEGRTVLVVDDEPAVLEMHARVVEARLPGCRVLEACDGREALRVIREEVPDLVLLDLMMPEVDGFAVLEGMQEGETTRGIPVIVLTGQELAVEDMERLNRGVAAVLGKGLFSAEETLTRIEETLAREHRLGNEAQRVVRRAMAYVHEHYADPISRADIAGHVGWGEDHLGRCFRRELGVSPIVYLTRTRIKQARQLLEEGKSVSWVAMAVGFSSRNYFSDVFRREVGMSPSAFRKSRRRGG